MRTPPNQNNILKSIPLVLSFIISLSACQVEHATIVDPQESVIASATLTSSPIIIATSTPTNTPEPTSTPVPTQIVFPVGNGTPLPEIDYEVLSPENIAKIEPIARYGAPERIRVELDPQNKHIYVASVDGIQIYDLQNEVLISEIHTRIRFDIHNTYTGRLREPGIEGLEISSNGEHMLLINENYDLELWTINGDKVWTRKMAWKDTKEGPDQFMHISANITSEKHLLAESYCTTSKVCKIIIWDLKTDTVLKEINGSYPVFSNSGKYLTYNSSEGAIRIFDFAVMKTIKTISIGGKFNTSYFYNTPNWLKQNVGNMDQIAIIKWDRIEIWDIPSGNKVGTLSGFQHSTSNGDLPKYVEFSPDGKYAIVISGTDIYSQQIHTFNIEDSAKPIEVLTMDVDTLYWIDNDGYIQQRYFENIPPYPWDILYEKPQLDFNGSVPVLYGSKGEYHQVDGKWHRLFSSEYTCISGNCDSVDIEPVKKFTVFNDQKKVFELIETEDHKAFSLLFQGQKISEITGTKVNIAGYSNHVAILEVYNGFTIDSTQLIDLDSGEVLFKGKNQRINNTAGFSGNLICMKLSPDGGWVNQQPVIVYDTENKVVLYEKQGYWSDFCIPLEQNRLILLVGGSDKTEEMGNGVAWIYQTLRLVDMKTNSEIAHLSKIISIDSGSNYFTPNTVNKDETLIALGYDNGIIWIYDPKTNQIIHEWNAHMDEILNLTFSDDGKFLASYSYDGYLTVWGIPIQP